MVLDDVELPDVEDDVPVPEDDVPDELLDEEPLAEDDDFDEDDTVGMALVIGSPLGEGRLISGTGC